MAKNEESRRAKIYSALEVANMCGVVNQTAINWIKSGHLKAFTTPGGQYRIYRDDLVSFITGYGMKLPEELIDKKNSIKNNIIVLVDDDKVINNALSLFLRKNLSDFVVYQSFDGFDAGAKLVQYSPRFVILDIDLPGIDGKALCKKIKNESAFGNPYVIIITGLEDDNLKSQTEELGADCFFKKPLDFNAILDKITQADAL